MKYSEILQSVSSKSVICSSIKTFWMYSVVDEAYKVPRTQMKYLSKLLKSAMTGLFVHLGAV